MGGGGAGGGSLLSPGLHAQVHTPYGGGSAAFAVPPAGAPGPGGVYTPKGWTPQMGQMTLDISGFDARSYWNAQKQRYCSFNGIPIYIKTGNSRNFSTALESGPTAWCPYGLPGGPTSQQICMNCGRTGHRGWECPIARALVSGGFIDVMGATLKPP